MSFKFINMESCCKYCGQEEKLDKTGYCIKYSCYIRSGEKERFESKLKEFESKAWKYLEIPKNKFRPLNIVSFVTNLYNERTRYCNRVMEEAELEFGYIPRSILKIIPKENQEAWDKNIKW